MKKLNLGCGGKILEGYINVDLYNEKADVKADVTDLPYEEESIDEILSEHVIEHFTPKEFDMLIRHWRDLLKPGGIIRLECPSLIACALKVIDGDIGAFHCGLFGVQDEPGQAHKNGFTLKSLSDELAKAGFEVLTAVEEGTDLKVVAKKL